MSDITTNLLKQFLSSHTIKGFDTLLYDGDINNLSITVDSSLANKWYDGLDDTVEFNDYNVNLYGDSFTIAIPVFSDEYDFEDITIEYRNLVADYLRDGLFSDKKGAIIFKLLDSFVLGLYNGIIAFYPQGDVSEKLLKSVTSTSNVQVGDINVELDINNLSDIKRYENIILLFKEVSDGYYDVRRHSLVDKVKGTQIQQEYTLGRDIYVKINSATQEVLEVTQEETKYSSKKEKNGWYIITPNIIGYKDILDEEGKVVGQDPIFEEINSKDFVPYKTISNGDITEIWMYGAYTHVLRDLLDFKPLTWQYNFLLNQKRISFVAGCRRAGKCLAPESRIRLSDGSFKNAIDLNINDKLLGSDKKSQRNIKAIEYYNKDIYEIELDNGMIIQTTGDHRIPTQSTFSGGNRDLNIDNYKTTEELTNKDFIPVMYNIEVGESNNYEESVLVGYIYGDGCRTKSNHSILAVHNNGQALRLISLIKNIGFEYKYNPELNKLSILDDGYLKKKYMYLDELSYNKRLDNKIFSFSKKDKRGIIDGLINTDGCLLIKNSHDKYNRKQSGCIEYCSTSEQLARDFQLLLSDVGVISYIRKKKIYSQFNKTNEFSYSVFITDKESLINIFNNCVLENKKNYSKLFTILESNGITNNTIGVVPLESVKEGTRTGILKPRYDYQRRKLVSGGLENTWGQYSWHRVKSVTYIKTDTVVDIEIDGDSLYWVDGILTHNTTITAYLILRSLWKQPNSIKHIQRQIKSLYLAPSEDKQKEVVDYIKSTSERIRLLKVIDFNKKENRLYLYDEVTSRNQKVQNVVSSCDFVSAKGFEPGRGKASDEIFIDEGSITPEDAFINLLPIIGNERAKLFAVGTIDWTTRRQWFYKWLIESERGIDPEQYGLRVTIDDLDEEHVPLVDRERMKRMLKDNKERYYAELYASFPDNTGVFNNEGFFGITRDRQPFEKVGGYIIGYDPAKRTDIGAIEVGEYRVGNLGTYIQLIEEYSLQGDYQNQKQVLSQIKNKYKMSGLGVPVYVVIDATQVGDVVAELFGDIIDYKVRWTSRGNRPSIDNYGAWKVPKNHLVHLTQILIEKGLLKGWVGLKELVDEFKNYKAIETASGGVKYEAEVGHDDHVSAMMLVGFYMGYIEGRVYEFAIDGQTIRPEGINEDGLYEEFAERSVRQLEEIIGKGFSFGV